MNEKNDWVKLEVESMEVRRGVKDGWMEVKLKVKGREEKKMIMRKVEKFLSENGGIEDLM